MKFTFLKIIKQSFSIKICLFIFIFSLIFIYFISSFYLKRERKLLIGKLKTQGSLLVETYGPLCQEAIKTKDDLSLMNYMEYIKSKPEVTWVMVLDPQTKILAHYQIRKWGKIAKDEISRKTILDTKPTIRIIPGEEKRKTYDFSFPLYQNETKIATLRLGILSSIEEKLKESRDKLLLLGAIFLFLITGTSYFLISSSKIPLNQIHSYLKTVSKGPVREKLELNREDEFGRLGSEINFTLEEINQRYQDYEKKIEKIQKSQTLFSQKLASHFQNPIVITDLNNQVIYSNQQAQQILFPFQKEYLGKHLLELVNNTEIIELVKKALQHPTQTIESHLKSIPRKIKLTSLESTDQELIGLIISFS